MKEGEKETKEEGGNKERERSRRKNERVIICVYNEIFN